MRLGSRLGAPGMDCDSGVKWTKGDVREGLNALMGGVCRLIGVFCDCLAMRIAPRFAGPAVSGSSS